MITKHPRGRPSEAVPPGRRSADADTARFRPPLSLDTFTVAFTVLGPGGLTTAQRRRFTALLVAFEAGMPLVGGPARFIAPATAAAVGIWFLRDDDGDADDDDDRDDEEARKAKALVTARGLTAVGLGLSISLDELAVGFSIGFSKLHPAAVVAAIAVQAFLAIQLGAYLGARLAGRYRARVPRRTGGPAARQAPASLEHPLRAAGRGPVDYWLRILDSGGRHRFRRPPTARIREGSERMAGIALLVLAGFLLAEPLILG